MKNWAHPRQEEEWMEDVSKQVTFGPTELVAYLVKTYKLQRQTPRVVSDLRDAVQMNPHVDEIFAIVNFAVSLGMPGADILEALENT